MVLVLGWAIWTLLVVRILGARATVGLRTLLTFLVLGGLLGAIIAPLDLLMVGPYHALSELSPLSSEAYAVITLVVLIGAVLPYLYGQRLLPALSVADAFLLAFFAGFGFDLVGALLAATASSSWSDFLAFLPPGQMTGSTATVAGNGYWAGLVAIAFVATLRFSRRLPWAIGAAAVVLFWTASDQAASQSLAAVAQGVNFGNYDTQFLGPLGILTLHGIAAAWFALAALVGLSIWEVVWVSSGRVGAPTSAGNLVAELQACLRALAAGRVGEYLRQRRLFALRRQVELVRTELAHSPGDTNLRLMVRELEERAQQLAVAPAPSVALPSFEPEAWKTQVPLLLQILAVVVLVILALIMPSLSISGTQTFWGIAPLQWTLGLPVTPIELLLMIVIAWRFLRSAGRPDLRASADDAVQFHGERGILTISLGAAFLVLFLSQMVVTGSAFSGPAVPNEATPGAIEEVFPPPSLLALYSQINLGPLDNGGVPAGIILLLFGVGASGLSMRRTARWQAVPEVVRRRTLVRHAITGAIGGALLLMDTLLYLPLLAWMHEHFGGQAYEGFGSGASGNASVAVATAIILALLTLLAAVLLRALADLVERQTFSRGGAAPMPGSTRP